MLGRKLYKTKLCILYQRGRCMHQNCSFAHGEAELRRFGGPANGRWDYRGVELRDKQDREYSPRRRFSPGRDGRGHHGFHSHKLAPQDRGYSASRSPVVKRGNRKRQQLDDLSDDSGRLKTSGCAEEQVKEGKPSSDGEIDATEEQLKQTKLDIEMLSDHKCQLEIFLEEKAQEVGKLCARMDDLEAQLNKEQEYYRRFSSKIKKLIKAHGCFLHAQEELKSSQSHIRRVCKQLDRKSENIEEDSSVHVTSDGEPSGDGWMSPRNDIHNHTSPVKKKLRSKGGTTEETKLGSSQKQERSLITSTGLDKLSQAEVFIPELENKRMEIERAKVSPFKNDAEKHLVDECKQEDIKRFTVMPLAEVRDLDSSRLLPSTNTAAHDVDDFIEAMETDEKFETGDAAVVFEEGRVDNEMRLPFLLPLPPKATWNNYNQCKDDDVEVEVEEV